jgi:hypothetical protein
MKKTLTALMLLFVLPVLFSCSGKKDRNDLHIEFEAETLRGKTLTFTDAEAGTITIPEKNMPKMTAIDRNGNPVYYTSEIAGQFTPGKDYKIGNRSGICVRFKVPQIASNDYLILKAETIFPHEITIAGNKSSSLDASYKYDALYSGRVEYIWFLFDESVPELGMDGEWIMKISSNDSVVYSASFNVTTGR